MYIRQEQKLIFGMKTMWWPNSLSKILHLGKKGRKVKINHLV